MPSAFTERMTRPLELLVRARAVELAGVIAPAQVGWHVMAARPGDSMIVGPWGDSIAARDPAVLAELDLSPCGACAPPSRIHHRRLNA